jgi:DNA invertase Pin-like site-specific DNA recombinase
MRALGYVRQSLAKNGESVDDSLSLEAQETAIKRYCIEKGWTLVDVIRDHDVTGKSWTRPGMLALIEQAQQDVCDIVVVYKLSRFARDTLYQEMTHRELKAHGVQLESVTEPGISSTLIRVVRAAVNQHQVEELSQWVSDSIKQRATRGLQHGEPPYGYRRVIEGTKKRYEIEADAADAVRLIFQWRAEGTGTLTIADRLNERGIPSESGGLWGKTSVRRILGNPRYAGYAVYRRQIVGDAINLPAIIDRPLWEQVQRTLGGKRTPRGKVQPSWLEGLVDHECGHPMYLASTPLRKAEGVFICGNRSNTKHRRCEIKPLNILTSALEDAARACLMADFAARKATAGDAIAAFAEHAGKPKVLHERALLEKRRAKLLAAIDRAADIVSDGLRDKAWLARKNEEQFGELAAIDAALAHLATIPTVEQITPSLASVNAMADGVRYARPDALRQALGKIGRVVFGPQGVAIAYHPEFRTLFFGPHRVKLTYNYGTRQYEVTPT